MKNIVLLFLIMMLFSNVVKALSVPAPEVQEKIFNSIRNEMIRLDGEGLRARKNRPQTFLQTTDQISASIKNNKNVTDFYSAFKQMDGTYTNLHSRAVFPDDIEKQIDLPYYKSQGVWLFAEVSAVETKFRIEDILDKNLQNLVSPGDTVVAINGRAINDWLDENFLFCKFPMRVQCDRQFEANLLSLNLSWKGNVDLIYTVQKQDQTLVDIKIGFFEDSGNQNNLRKRCDWRWQRRYPGFKLIHLGFYACLFEKEDDPSIGLLRINSFSYGKRQLPENPFKSIEEEVSALEKVWVPKSGQYANLIIDLLDNHGGNAPIPYYQILLKGDFQEQYVQFKKTPEFEDPRLRQSMLWNDNAQELLYQKYLNSGLWSAIKYGEYTPPSPMFCPDDSMPCDEGFFRSKPHQFSGKVSVMLNEECVSSCDGFSWTMKAKLGARFYGFPQASDSAYSRLRIDAILDPTNSNGFRIEFNPHNGSLDPNLIVGQIVAVTRATDENGIVFNGNPISLEELVPYTFNDYYPAKVLNRVLLNFSQKQ